MRYITITETTHATINYIDCSVAVETVPSVQIHWSRIGRDLLNLGKAIVSVAREAMVMSDVSLSALALVMVQP